MTTIAEYSQIEAALALLSDRYRGVTYVVTKADGMKLAKEARSELRGYRTALEEKRVEIKAPALERCRAIDAEAKRITTALLALEEPIEAQIKTEENRKAAEKAAKEKAEVERVAAITKRLADLERWPLAVVGWPAAKLADALARLATMPPRVDHFEENLSQALAAHTSVIQKLTEMHRAALAAEGQAAELAKLKADQAEREKAIADRERESRERLDAESRAARVEREKADEQARQARLAEQARIDVERQKLDEERQRVEAAKREERRREEHRLDAREMLATFVTRYGDLPEFTSATTAIRECLAKFDLGKISGGRQTAAGIA